MGVLTLLLAPAAFPQISPPSEAKMFFTGIVGSDPRGGHRVLLRWYPVEGELPFEQYTLYRKPGDDSTSNDEYELLTHIGEIRNINTIRSIFEQPGSRVALEDLKDILHDITREEITDDNYAQLLIEVLEGGCETCGFQNSTFAQVNWGVAIVEGLGYVDPVGSGLQTYELHVLDATGDDSLVVGKITIDANVVTELPPPIDPVEVVIPGPRGDRTVFLRWDLSVELLADFPLAFGFNVYRYSGHVGSVTDFLTLLDSGLLTQVNSRPIVVLSPTPYGEDPNEVYFFADDGTIPDVTGPRGPKFTPGTSLTYWVTARDLFGQRGTPSEPVEVVVRDGMAPEVPKNPSTQIVRIGGQRRIELVWDRNSDDTIFYNIYRYRQYDHAGSYGPFSPVDGLTEGYVSSVAQPAVTDTVTYRDTAISESAHENRAYWYCVSAEDAYGNESGLSQPVRGVLFDTTPPKKPSVRCVERYHPYCRAELEQIDIEYGIQGSHMIFHVHDERSGVQEMTIRREMEGYEPVLVYSGPIVPNASFTIDDIFIPPGNVEPEWIFRLYRSKEQCSGKKTPHDINVAFVKPGVRMNVLVTLSSSGEPICEEDKPGRVPHNPTAGDNLTPVAFFVPRSDDAVGAILYRSHDCDKYQPIAEKHFAGEDELELQDYFHPTSPSVTCYALRSFDENYNLSSFYYIQTQIVFVGAGISIIPAVQRISSLGDRDHPIALVEWFGPRSGISAYSIRFLPGPADDGGPAYQSRWFPNELFYEEATSTWAAEVMYIDEDSRSPLTPDIPYQVEVIVYDSLLQAVTSTNEIQFVWSDIAVPSDYLDWPVRPRPSKSTFANPPVYDPGPLPGTSMTGGVLVKVGGPISEVNMTIESRMTIPFPFVFYRQRVDIPGQSWMQISPLFEYIGTKDEGTILKDPFFHDTYQTGVYFLDNTGLVKNAQYRYQMFVYNEQGELLEVYGPSSTVVITP